MILKFILLICSFIAIPFSYGDECNLQTLKEKISNLEKSLSNECLDEIVSYSVERKNSAVSTLISLGRLDDLIELNKRGLNFIELNKASPVDFIMLSVGSLRRPKEVFLFIESKGVKVNDSYMGGKNVVYYILEMKKSDILEYLMEQEKYYPLLLDGRNAFAAASSGNIMFLKFFLNSGGEIPSKDENGMSIIDYASIKGQNEVVDFILGNKNPLL
jgi:hypothetical protein